MKKRVYIAGKVTGLPIHEVTMKFGAVQKALEAQGYEVVNPLEVVGDFNCDWRTAMKKCIAALVECNIVIFLPCFTESKGATLEYQIAWGLGIERRFLAKMN